MAKAGGKKGMKSMLRLLVLILVSIAALFGKGIEQGNLTNAFLSNGDEVYVHFIDVGQGSSTLIQQGKKGILIDAGEADYGEALITYIGATGVESLEYVIASHPHSDHIGAMTDVFEAFTVGEVLMPELSEINMPTTRLYENFMTYIYDNGMEVSFPGVGDTYSMESVSVTILGPTEQDDDLNNMSLICKVEAGDTDVMILGDAEKSELSDVYAAAKDNLKSDIIAMGHHGSSTSVHKKFLDSVNADVAVISCGKDNSYGHPHREALEYIDDSGMQLFRTDYDGNIVFKIGANGYEKVN